MHFAQPLLVLSLAAAFAAPSAHAQRGGRGATWAPDGKHLLIDGKWIEPLSGEEVDRPASDAPETPDAPDLRSLFREAITAAGETVGENALTPRPARSTIPRTPDPRPGMRASDDDQHAAAILGGQLWAYTRDGEARKLRDGLERVRQFHQAPDGRSVSYIHGDDLYVTHTQDGTTFRLSDDGDETLFYGELDWVYQEEVYGRFNFQASWWSPDSQHLAFLRIDETGVDTFTVIDHIPNQLAVEPLKYPKSGSVNPRATLHIARAKDGRVVPVDLSAYKPEDEILLVRVSWTPEGDAAVVQVQDREQTWLDLCFVDPNTGESRRVLHESSDTGWVNVLSGPRWLDDGSFLWESERTGFKHLYRYGRDGTLLATLTSGDWQVKRIVRLDEARGWLAFTGTRESAVGAHGYRVGLDGSGFMHLTRGRGTHSISLNDEGSLLLDTYSSLEDPGRTVLRKANGSEVRTLSEREAEANAHPTQLEQIKARDGELLDITISRPKGFDASVKYPVWIDTYSGPDAPTVRDRWSGRSTWYTDNGIVLLQCNVRSASGRGQKFTDACYRQFGVQELRDLEDAIDWLGKTHAWSDTGRVGISGWSYGGFMAAYALTHSKKFKCGVAGAGVYDWRLYDTIYTERYMATPQNNPEGYKVSSVVEAAENLHGQLLIVHGTMDDNVHMQNAVQLIHELQKAGKKNFEFMLYPKARHGVRSKHLQGLRQDFILEWL